MILYGAGGHAKVVMDAAESCGIAVHYIIDDQPGLDDIFGVPVVQMPSKLVDEPALISVGNNRIRKKIASQFSGSFGKIIHSRASVSTKSEILEGSVVMSGAVVNASVKIGRHCIINSAAVIEHDCIIHDFVHVSPNAAVAGGVEIGEGTHIGTGVCVIPGIKIGQWCTIGAGAVVIRDIPDFCTAVGNPAKVIKQQLLND